MFVTRISSMCSKVLASVPATHSTDRQAEKQTGADQEVCQIALYAYLRVRPCVHVFFCRFISIFSSSSCFLQSGSFMLYFSLWS